MRRILSSLVLTVLVALFSGCGAGVEQFASEELQAGSSALSASSVVPGGDAVVVPGVSLNLRSGPGTQYAVLRVLGAGTRAHVTGDAVNGFYPLAVPGVRGWSSGRYLTAAPLQTTVNNLALAVGSASPGTEMAISVRNLSTGEVAHYNGATTFVSASSAKAIWVAAALRQVGAGPVAPYAGAVFRNSDNYASGSVIDLVGPNAENVFYQAAGMSRSAFTQWNFGKTRVATNSPRLMGWDNYFTTDDAVTFLTGLDDQQLLGAGNSLQLEQWMTWTPRSGYGGWLGTQLPAEARASMMHKAGWLPPGCCSGNINSLNEIGIVQVPRGARYAVAIFTRYGQDYWGRQVPFLESASLKVYNTVAGL